MAKYINRDELLERLCKLENSLIETEGHYNLFTKGFGECLSQVKNFLTAEVIPIEVVENYLSNLTDEWDKLGDRKYELANMQVYNHIRKEQDDLEEWRVKNV